MSTVIRQLPEHGVSRSARSTSHAIKLSLGEYWRHSATDGVLEDCPQPQGQLEDKKIVASALKMLASNLSLHFAYLHADMQIWRMTISREIAAF